MRLDTRTLARTPATTKILVAGYLAFLLVSAITLDLSLATRFGATASLVLAWAFFALSIAATIAIIRAKGKHEHLVTVRLVVLALLVALPLRFLAAYITGPGVPSVGSSALHFPLLIILTGLIGSWIIAPLAEEWVFRGYLLPEEPTWRDIAFNATLFAVLHPWNFTQVELTLRTHASVLILGLVLAVVKKRARSTWACVALHFFINVAGLLTLQVTTDTL